MKIVVAFDTFKGSLSAQEACEIACKAIHSVRPDCNVVLKPMADGGEGTVAAIRSAFGGLWIPVQVAGPLPPRLVRAGFVWFPSRRVALIEMASASGLMRLRHHELNPLKTTTYGTGTLIAAAIRKGAQRIWLAVGGSATLDGGVGAAKALGWKFLDNAGREIGLGGKEIERITDIVAPIGKKWPPMDVLCDVDNHLTGKNGAARVYGPQKGATPRMVAQLDRGLRHLSRLVTKQLGRRMNVLRGGASGGLAAGAVAFFNARLLSGIEMVMNACRLPEELKDADWVITGEGSFDLQSLRGKVVSGVLQAARVQGVCVAVVAGSIRIPRVQYRHAGVQIAISLRQPGMSMDRAIAEARTLLYRRVRELTESEIFAGNGDHHPAGDKRAQPTPHNNAFRAHDDKMAGRHQQRQLRQTEHNG
jgi:glycerate kinase